MSFLLVELQFICSMLGSTVLKLLQAIGIVTTHRSYLFRCSYVPIFTNCSSHSNVFSISAGERKNMYRTVLVLRKVSGKTIYMYGYIDV